MSIACTLGWFLLLYSLATPASATPSPETSPTVDESPLPADHSSIYASCSRNRSRVARMILQDYLWERVEQLKYTLPGDCKLRPLDIYSEQEKKKVDMGRNEWRCMICNKLFRGEEFLDKHFENRHGSTINTSRHCLADVCDVAHCDWWEWRKAGAKRPQSCQPVQALQHRRACEALTQRCFPSSGGSMSRQLADFFQQQFCDTHSCDKGVKMFPLGLQKKEMDSLLALMGTALLSVVIFGFYACVYSLWRSKGATKLHHMSSKRKRAKWSSMWSKKPFGKQS